jgi:aspartyl-tRNA(Asn)/glutamyl-tRNA(Gln) amidotransferase subunit C
MKITKEDTGHVAELARLRFNEDDIELFTRQLNKILEYFEKLKNVDTSSVAPSTHSVDITNAYRDDHVKNSIPVEHSLSNAPDSEQAYFKVPKIIEV